MARANPSSFRVVEVQDTPNPNAMKFMLDRPISDRPISFLKRDAATGHALAEKLFAIEGVVSVFLLNDFVTVNKSPEAHWKDLTAKVKQVLTRG